MKTVMTVTFQTVDWNIYIHNVYELITESSQSQAPKKGMIDFPLTSGAQI